MINDLHKICWLKFGKTVAQLETCANLFNIPPTSAWCWECSAWICPNSSDPEATANKVLAMSSDPSFGRRLSNTLDRTFQMHDDGWVRSTLHAGAHTALGAGALLKFDNDQAKKEFARAKEQWSRKDPNPFGRIEGPGSRAHETGRGILNSPRSKWPDNLHPIWLATVGSEWPSKWEQNTDLMRHCLEDQVGRRMHRLADACTSCAELWHMQSQTKSRFCTFLDCPWSLW